MLYSSLCNVFSSVHKTIKISRNLFKSTSKQKIYHCHALLKLLDIIGSNIPTKLRKLMTAWRENCLMDVLSAWSGPETLVVAELVVGGAVGVDPGGEAEVEEGEDLGAEAVAGGVAGAKVGGGAEAVAVEGTGAEAGEEVPVYGETIEVTVEVKAQERSRKVRVDLEVNQLVVLSYY